MLKYSIKYIVNVNCVPNIFHYSKHLKRQYEELIKASGKN